MIVEKDCKYCGGTGRELGIISPPGGHGCYDCGGSGTIRFEVPTYEDLIIKWNESYMDETQDRFIYNELLEIIRKVLETPSIIIRD